LYNRVNVTTFSTIEGLSNPDGPPFFSLRVVGWVPCYKKKVGDEGRTFCFLPWRSYCVSDVDGRKPCRLEFFYVNVDFLVSRIISLDLGPFPYKKSSPIL